MKDMSVLANLLNNLIEVTEYDLEQVEIWLHHRRRHHFIPVAGRFSGMFYRDPQTGEIVMATQTLIVGVAFTCPLVFTDASGTPGPGPIGTITASDPSVTVSLSADGQSANAEMTTTLPTPATLTWTDPAGVVPSFTTEVTDAAAVFTPTAGSFGAFVEGTTP